MPSASVLLLSAAAVIAVWGVCVAVLVAAGRRSDARALARFVPDCLVLFKRLLGEDRVPRTRKLLLLAGLAYLASPIDLVPDVIPVAGQLDDAILVALILRAVLRSAGPAILDEHWPGPAQSLATLKRAVGLGAGRGEHPDATSSSGNRD